MEATVEARNRERTGEIAGQFEHRQRAFVMIGKVGSGDHGDQEDLRIAGLRQAMIAMAEGVEYVGNDDESGYNTNITHR
jgi:hypothetical protein